MTTAERIAPIVLDIYGDTEMSRAAVLALAEKIDGYEGNDREHMIMLACWDWFTGGATAAATAVEIEEALR